MIDFSIQLQHLETKDLTTTEKEKSILFLEQTLDSTIGESQLANTPKKIKTELFIFLATHFLQKAITSKGEEKERCFLKMRNYLGKSDRIELTEKRAFILKGFYCFFMNDFKQANDYFENARENDEINLSVLIGRGMIEFHNKNYSEALIFWKTAFRNFKNDCPEIAYLLGQIYFRQAKYELAIKCFLYLLKHAPQTNLEIHLLTGLALANLRLKNYDQYYDYLMISFSKILLKGKIVNKEIISVCENILGKNENHFNLSNFIENNEESLDWTIFDANVISNLAEHYFYKKDFEKSLKLTEIALHFASFWPIDKGTKGNETRADYLELKSRLLYIQAFIEHSKLTQDSMESAYKLYCAAIQDNPFNFSAQFGLAQVHLFQKNYQEAMNCLENICKNTQETDCQEVYRLLPLLYSRTNRKTLATTYFNKAILFFPNNVELLIDYSNFLDNTDSKNTITIYEKIQDLLILEKNKRFVQPELLNNMAVCLAKDEKYEKAKSCLDKAFQIAAVESGDIKSTVDLEPSEHVLRMEAVTISILYNSALIYQKLGLTNKAIDLLKNVILRNPAIYETYMTLSVLYWELGDLQESKVYIEKAIAVSCKFQKISKLDNVFYTKVNLLISQKNFQQALFFLQKVKGSDSYYLLLKVKLYYNLILNLSDNILECKRFIQEAAIIFNTIFNSKDEDGNLYAAIMSAVMLLERGRISDAAEIFKSFHDLLRENQNLLHNQSILDYYCGDFERIILRHESLKNVTTKSYKSVYALAYTSSGNYEKADKIWKYRLLMNPGRKSRFNYGAFLHERLKSMIHLKNKSIDEIEHLILGGSLANRLLSKVYSSITEKNLLLLDPALNQPEIFRKQLDLLRKKAEHQIFLLNQNWDGYQQHLNREKKRVQEQQLSLENRKYLIEKQKESLILIDEERNKLKKLEEEEIEKKAREIEEKARVFGEQFLLAHTISKESKKRPEKVQKKVILEKEKNDFENPRKHKKKSKNRNRKRREEEFEEEFSDNNLGESDNQFIVKDEDSSEEKISKSIGSDSDRLSLKKRKEFKEKSQNDDRTSPKHKLKKIKQKKDLEKEKVDSRNSSQLSEDKNDDDFEQKLEKNDNSDQEKRNEQVLQQEKLPINNIKKKRVFLDEEDDM